MYTNRMMSPVIKTPVRINPCPIFEAVVELRFESSLPEEVIPGLLFSGFKDKYPKTQRLPLSELPPAIRNSDSNLIFSPHFQFIQDKIVVNVGPRVFSVGCQYPYAGWEKYFAEIQDAFRKAIEIGLVTKAIRLGVRYINFFKDVDVFRKAKVSLDFDSESLIGNKNNLRTELIEGNYVKVIHISNNANIAFQGQTLNGSIIDIDIVNNSGPSLMTSLYELIAEAHNKEKLLFFSLLTEEFLKTLNPEY